MPTPLYSGVGNPWTSRFVWKDTIEIAKLPRKGRQKQKFPFAQQSHAEIALRRKLDCRTLGRDAETLDAGLKGLSPSFGLRIAL